MNINTQIGHALRLFRKKRNMTLEEAAKAMNISHQSLFKYEQGETKVSSEAIYKLSKIYDIPIENFFTHVEDGSFEIHNITEKEKRKPLRIMLVEDDITDAELLQDCIKQVNADIKTHVFNSPDLAENYLRNAHHDLPDLVLLDLNLPNHSGFQLLRAIKSSKNFLHIPVIIWSGSLNYSDLKKSYAYGATAYMCKSYDINDLLSSVRKLIDFWQEVALLNQG